MAHHVNRRHLLRPILHKRTAAAFFASAVLTLLSACSSGSGGTDVTIGDGQSMDPVTLDFPVFYVKRPVPDPDDTEVMDYDIREPLGFQVGADLYMRDQASPSTPEVNLTEAQTQGVGDIRDVDVNFDGTKVIFSMRIIEDPDQDPLPTWNIWEYDVTTSALRRIITSDTTAEEGHDIMPHYLPDGRIVFTSTRQRQSRAILLDENKPQYAAQVEAGPEQPTFLLHVMDADGANIKQITFNQSHDLDPSVLSDGRIVYTHWEQALAGSQMDLYVINPDGSDRQLLYGAHSHATGTVDPETNQPSTIHFLQPRAMQDGRTLALIRPFTGTDEGGDLVLIDTANYVDNERGASPANAGLPGPAQMRALPTDVRTIPGPSPGGRYRSASPLFDGTNRLLVSWSQCRLIVEEETPAEEGEEGRIVPCTSERLENTVTPPVEAPPLYGVYIYDVRDNTQKPIVAPQEGFIFTEVVAGAARALPPVLLDRVAGVDYPDELLSESAGILSIRSVYDIDGVDTAEGGLAAISNPSNPAYQDRPARFLRIEKVVSQPDEDTQEVPNTHFGVAGRRFGMRDILGYAPIEPDGSVLVKVPANVAFAISVLDANGRRLGGTLGARHSSWLQAMPGETLQCNGCHAANADPAIAHGRRGLTDSVNAGALTTGAAFPGANPVLAPFDAGETMAQARGRAMCGGVCEPSVDIAFDDWWQPNYDPATTPGSIDMCYGTASNIKNDPANANSTHVCINSLSTPPPTTDSCMTEWTGLCRITIHYPQVIQEVWDVARPDLDVDGDDVADVDTNNEPYRCTTCHSPAAPDGTAQAPAGDLDLSGVASAEEPAHLISYRELLVERFDRELDADGNVFIVQEEVGVDAMGNPILQPVRVPTPMSGGSARQSGRFFNAVEGVTTEAIDHSDFMSPSELRLISEWLDIGAQYYNDPFVAPEN